MSARRRLSPELRRAELLDAAEKVISKLGHAARVEDVVAEAGAAKGTFFVYFPAWRDLIVALRARVFVKFDERYPMPVPGKGKIDWMAAVERIAEGFVDGIKELGGLHDVIFHGEIAEEPPEDPNHDAIHRIAIVIRAGMAAGQFGKLDPKPAARSLFAMLHAAADAIVSGAPREKELASLRMLIRRCLKP